MRGRNEAMMVLSILTRRLKKGKTYEDFRKAWYHTVGYGLPVRLYSAINVFDQREIVVVALGEIKPGQDPMRLIQIEVKERLDHPLEAVIEPEIGRTFGIVVSEDNFSPTGRMEFRPASVDGKETNFKEIGQGLEMARKLFTHAAAERDAAKKRRLGKKRR
jgi:hypothetical protein